MKGNKAYALAQAIHKEMYSNNQRKETNAKLYRQYFELIRKAAYQGHIEALFDMGQQYEDVSFLGSPNPIYNPKKSVYWYTKACQKGHAEACNNLSNFYAKGEGCTKNFSMSLELLKRSADLGSLLGKKNLKMELKRFKKNV